MTESVALSSKPEKTGKESPKKKVPRQQKKKTVLKIVLDTNQLFTGSASDLLQAALKTLIQDNSHHSDVEIQWHIPEIVKLEREYQMTEAALEILPTLQKLDRLLGHSLGVTGDILISRVKEAIESQIKSLGLHVINLSTQEVNWDDLVQKAAFRRPPFERGKTEKGFRDAIISECFSQLVCASPKSPSICRCAMATADGILGKVIEANHIDSTNVRVLRSLDDIQNLINTLVSTATEEYVASVREVAATFFFSKENKDGLYYKEKISEGIRENFESKLKEPAPGASIRENGTWFIAKPSFIKKSGQKITWKTSITIEAVSYKYERDMQSLFTPNSFDYRDYLLSNQPIISAGTTRIESSPSNYLINPRIGEQLTIGDYSRNQNLLTSITEQQRQQKVLVAKGKTIFYVNWSASVTAAKKFIHPKIESIGFSESTWQ